MKSTLQNRVIYVKINLTDGQFFLRLRFEPQKPIRWKRDSLESQLPVAVDPP